MTTTSSQDTPTRRRRWVVPAAVALAVVLIATAATVALAPGGTTSPPAPNGSPIAMPVASASPSMEASGPLIAMADLLVDSPGDATQGRYYYTRVEEWARADDQIIGFYRQDWYTPTGGLTRWQKRIAGQPAASFDMARIGIHGTFDGAMPKVETGAPDEVKTFTEKYGPPSGNPVLLAKAIDDENGGKPYASACPPACDITISPMVFFSAISSLYRTTYLDRAARAALLRLVAVERGVVFLGEVTDRAGRKAIGVAITERGVRFALLFDRATGVLLASERGVPGWVLDDYCLFLALDRRDNTDPATAKAA